MAGRGKKAPLDLDRVKKLAAVGLTVEEIAVVEGVNKRTIERNALGIVDEGRMHMNASLKRKQYEMAMSGNVTMLIWLGKQHLGQTDKREEKHDFGSGILNILQGLRSENEIENTNGSVVSEQCRLQ